MAILASVLNVGYFRGRSGSLVSFTVLAGHVLASFSLHDPQEWESGNLSGTIPSMKRRILSFPPGIVG